MSFEEENTIILNAIMCPLRNPFCCHRSQRTDQNSKWKNEQIRWSGSYSACVLRNVRKALDITPPSLCAHSKRFSLFCRGQKQITKIDSGHWQTFSPFRRLIFHLHPFRHPFASIRRNESIQISVRRSPSRVPTNDEKVKKKKRSRSQTKVFANEKRARRLSTRKWNFNFHFYAPHEST